MINMENLMIVISGPSGVGKGTIIKKLFSDCDRFALSVSATTRSKRDGEIDGVHYHYKTKKQFDELVEKRAFLETFEIYGNQYGTLKSDVQEKMSSGKDVILEIDVQGGIKIKQEMPESILVFVLPPSKQELEYRLKGRNSENEESLKIRTCAAIDEIKKCKFYDYVVLNASIDKAVCDIINIVECEKMKSARNTKFIESIIKGDRYDT